MKEQKGVLDRWIRGAAAVLRTEDFHRVDCLNFTSTGRVENPQAKKQRIDRNSIKGVIR